MGFCILNNVAVAARYAQAKHRLDKVLIIDWDVHHGNGTQDIFQADPSVLLFSTHQWPWYPGTGRAGETGKGKGRGTVINCPLPAGSGRDEVLGAFREKLLPAARTFRPEMIFISAGFDSRKGDPLGGFTLTDADFTELTRFATELAEDSADGRIVSVLEGGYDLEGLASASRCHVAALAAGRTSPIAQPSAGYCDMRLA
jgi:acetoin utilization deacetylase AcuC-like enzyme